MTFKEARAEARNQRGAAIGRFKDGGWFVDKSWKDSRDLFYVRKDGSLIPLTDTAKQFLKKRQKTS